MANLRGTENGELIEGTALIDLIEGLGGDDQLIGLDGNDKIYGGWGNDDLLGDNGNDLLYGEQGRDFLSGGAGNDTLNGGDDKDQLFGDGGDDALYGGSGDDALSGGAGNDILDGGLGVDMMLGELGNDSYYVDSLGDIIFENDKVNQGIDKVYSSITMNLVDPQQAGGFIEHITLIGTGNINAIGNSLNNAIAGNSGHNSLIGGAGDDILTGYAGNDILNGQLGSDKMSGGVGNDSYYIDTAGDVVDESAAGSDGVDKVFSSIGIGLLNSTQIKGSIENLTLIGEADIDGAGNGLNNVIAGNVGNNTLMGLNGDDTLNGQEGDDLLYGGQGSNTLIGGTGADKFVFDSSPNGTIDTIFDFNVTADAIWLDDNIFGQIGVPGLLAASAFHVGSSADNANDRIIYNFFTGALYYDSNGSGAGGSVQIASLDSGLSMTNADFLVI